MKKEILSIAVFILLIFTSASYSAGLTADEIVKKATHASLYQGKDIKGKISIEITDSLGRKRSRVLNMMRKNVPGSDAQKYFVLFLRPADIKKMVFMVLKHGVPEQDDDRWLYIPGLDLVKRIAASDKRTSFAGSDFLYEDISGRNPIEDIHTLVETTDKYYLIKSTPLKPERVEFEYYNAYIDKNTFIPLKIEYFKQNSRLYRTIKAEKIENLISIENGMEVTYPTVILSIAQDIENRSTSKMKLENIEYNSGIKDEYFSERYLRRPPKMLLR